MSIKSPIVAFLLIVFAQSSSAANDNSAGNIFSTPDSQTPLPTIGGQKKSQASTVAQDNSNLLGKNNELPSREEINSVPSLSEYQRKQIDMIYKQESKDEKAISDQLGSLRHSLQENQSASKLGLPPIAPDRTAIRTAIQTSMPGAMPAMEFMPVENNISDTASSDNIIGRMYTYTTDSLKGHIDKVNSDLLNLRMQAWRQLCAVLTPQELSDWQKMREGSLVITSNSTTDAPDPSHKPAPPPTKLLSPSVGNPLNGVLLNTTQRVLRSTILRF